MFSKWGQNGRVLHLHFIVPATDRIFYGRTAGGLYAGASAGNGVGASAALGGGLGAGGVGAGGIGAESHAGGVSRKVVKLTETQPESVKTVTYVDETPPNVDASYSSSFNAHSSVNGGINGGQSAVVSTYNAQSPLGTVDSQSSLHTNVETAPQSVHVQKFKKRIHHHRLRPNHNKVLTIEKRVQVPQYQTNTQSQTQTNIQSGWGQQPAAGFDYRKFFDFGFFANTAAGFGGPHLPQQPYQTQTVTVEKTVPQQPQIVYEERVVPKVVYEKRIVPQVVVEKKIVPETVVVQKTIQPVPATATFTKEVQVEKRIESDVNKEVNVAASPVQTQGTYGGSSSQSHFGFSGGYNHQAGANLINDIFNIPIATLQAVNRLVSNKVAGGVGGGANIDIQKTITVN
ncbi:hypothetical protein Bhyg_06226 [Pseudolycoriella hygida]|uniref:Uncharacterized protein n=1 Tax=Pseudolycoriella hygida TaxID=35572 RepID=A0A9Q0S2M4_9DIPT|nr:hypothetical protein Bhyg_06226 [Pseudolycoriella hygida]